jgi:hypothetical protein
MKKPPTENTNWIEVCDGCELPNNNEKCVVATELSFGGGSVPLIDGNGVFQDGNFVSCITGIKYQVVTHWSRLPI